MVNSAVSTRQHAIEAPRECETPTGPGDYVQNCGFTPPAPAPFNAQYVGAVKTRKPVWRVEANTAAATRPPSLPLRLSPHLPSNHFVAHFRHHNAIEIARLMLFQLHDWQ
jgi:hypothetical protein